MEDKLRLTKEEFTSQAKEALEEILKTSKLVASDLQLKLEESPPSLNINFQLFELGDSEELSSYDSLNELLGENKTTDGYLEQLVEEVWKAQRADGSIEAVDTNEQE